MSIDGTKIIDGDLAHDVYNEFMDCYDEGMELETLRLKFLHKYHSSGYDDWDFEIYFTAYALALWETGNLTAKDLEDVKLVVKKGAGVKKWHDASEENGIARKKVLDRFIAKISNPKAKPRKRKKYRIIKNFQFQEDDVLAFQFPDGNWGASILVSISQYRNNCSYYFFPTSFKGSNKPSIAEILETSVFFTKVRCSLENDRFKDQRQILEKMYPIDIKTGGGFYLGCVVCGIYHQNLRNFKNNFERIGKVSVLKAFKKLGAYASEDNFEQFVKHHRHWLNNTHYETISLKLVLDSSFEM